MPKKKETLTEDEVSVDVLGLSHKKHKKHKHKKHRKRKGGLEDGEDSDNSPDTPGDGFKPGLRLKIKIGGQTFGETRVPKPEVNETGSDESTNIDVVGASPSIGSLSPVSGNLPKKAKKMDEEEAWLAALEAGRLEEVDDELRRMKDPTLMTARQRSLLESKAQKEKEEAAAPVVVETKVLSEEMIQKKIIKAKKRKEQAEEKLQKDKKQTLERLLKKSDSKPRTKKVIKKVDVPRMKYIDSEITGRSLSFPVGTCYPLKAQSAKEPPPPVFCGVKGCENRKKYSCSKTGIPLCSLSCYKKNMAVSGLAITV